MKALNEALNEIYLQRKKVHGEIVFLKAFLEEKMESLDELNYEYNAIQMEMRKPNFDRISKKELVKCFSHKIKPEEVSILVEREGICYPIQRVSELETETELWIRLNYTKYNPICIVINEDRSFKVKEHGAR